MDDGREGGRPGSPGGPVIPSTRLPAELRFCDVGECAPAGGWSWSETGCSRAVWSSCADIAGFEYLWDADGSPTVVMMRKVKRWECQESSSAATA